MIKIEVITTNFETGEVTVLTETFKKDKDSFDFLEKIHSIKIQKVYDKLNIGVYNPKRPVKFTNQTSYLGRWKPLTKKQKENNNLYTKIAENINESTEVKITHA
jgi:hypothetical protein